MAAEGTLPKEIELNEWAKNNVQGYLRGWQKGYRR